MNASPNTISLHITLQKPPVNLHYSLQKGSGAKYEPVQIQLSAGHDLEFNLKVELRVPHKRITRRIFAGRLCRGLWVAGLSTSILAAMREAVAGAAGLKYH